MPNKIFLRSALLLFCASVTLTYAQHDMHGMAKKETGTGASDDITFGGKTVRYDLFVKDTLVNFSGRPARAIATNGKL